MAENHVETRNETLAVADVETAPVVVSADEDFWTLGSLTGPDADAERLTQMRLQEALAGEEKESVGPSDSGASDTDYNFRRDGHLPGQGLAAREAAEEEEEDEELWPEGDRRSLSPRSGGRLTPLAGGRALTRRNIALVAGVLLCVVFLVFSLSGGSSETPAKEGINKRDGITEGISSTVVNNEPAPTPSLVTEGTAQPGASPGSNNAAPGSPEEQAALTARLNGQPAPSPGASPGSPSGEAGNSRGTPGLRGRNTGSDSEPGGGNSEGDSSGAGSASGGSGRGGNRGGRSRGNGETSDANNSDGVRREGTEAERNLYADKYGRPVDTGFTVSSQRNGGPTTEAVAVATPSPGTSEADANNAFQRKLATLPRGTKIPLRLENPLKTGVEQVVTGIVTAPVRNSRNEVVLERNSRLLFVALAQEVNGRAVFRPETQIVSAVGEVAAVNGQVYGSDNYLGLSGKLIQPGRGNVLTRTAGGIGRAGLTLGGALLGRGVAAAEQSIPGGDSGGGSVRSGAGGGGAIDLGNGNQLGVDRSGRLVEIPQGIIFSFQLL